MATATTSHDVHVALSIYSVYVRAYVYMCMRVYACARIKNTLRFLDPPTSVLVKYLVIRRKVRPPVYLTCTMSGATFPPRVPVPFSLILYLSSSPFALCDIVALIEYTYANSSLGRRNCNLLLPRCRDTNHSPRGRTFFFLLPRGEPFSLFQEESFFTLGTSLLETCAFLAIQGKKSKNRKGGKGMIVRRVPKEDELSPRVCSHKRWTIIARTWKEVR